MYETVAPESWPCAVCDKPATTRVHNGCRQRISDNLAELPRLYRQLADVLAPGRRGGDGRSGPRTASLPCSLEVLDLRTRGGIENVVGGWARDVSEREGWEIPELGSVEAIVDWGAGLLAVNLAMLCDEHPAIKEIANELRDVAAQARRLVTGEKEPIRVPVACQGCGHILRVSLGMDGIRCTRCQTQYDHDEMLRLKPTRSAAA